MSGRCIDIVQCNSYELESVYIKCIKLFIKFQVKVSLCDEVLKEETPIERQVYFTAFPDVFLFNSHQFLFLNSHDFIHSKTPIPSVTY